jgi:hypothetical protein
MKTSLLSILVFASLQVMAQTHKTYPLVKFDEIESAKSDTIRIRAVVLDVYVCPVCPPGMICKPCIPNHFTIIKEKIDDREKLMKAQRMRIFMDQPQSLKSGQRYEFVVRFRSKENRAENLEWIATLKQK